MGYATNILFQTNINELRSNAYHYQYSNGSTHWYKAKHYGKEIV